MGTPCGRLKKVWDMHGMVSVTRRLRELGRVGDMVRHLRMSVSAVTAGVAAALAAVLASTVGEAAAQPPFRCTRTPALPRLKRATHIRELRDVRGLGGGGGDDSLLRHRGPQERPLQ